MNSRNFAYYRLPYADHYVLIESAGDVVTLPSLRDLNNKSGFVISPFDTNGSLPTVMICPDRISVHQIAPDNIEKKEEALPHPTVVAIPAVTEEYSNSFKACHDAVSSGVFRKLVLARCRHTEHNGKDLKETFLSACAAYPRLMIMLFSTSATGTWIVTSPEILVEKTEGLYHTVALAGTMPYTEGYSTWSNKNIEEQRVVEKYIDSIVTPLSREVTKDGPATTRAGHLVHLRTDFRFHTKEETGIGDIVERLHPTPAVCGLPKDAAKDFLLAHEGFDRRYYSGFAGPVNINGSSHLYVSLRCAELTPTHDIYYAGGGLMKDSVCAQEWEETEVKMKTIARILQ